MLKNVLSYICIVLGLALLWASTSRTAMQYITEKRDKDAWYGTYQGMNGDLIGMSYLDFVKRFQLGPRTPLKRANYNGEKNTVLYIHGDSYARKLHDSVFAGVSALHNIDRNHGMAFTLDTTKRNILIIEVSERYIRPYFSGIQILDEVYDSATHNKPQAYHLTDFHKTYAASMLSDVKASDFFNKNINQNLQCNLFNYSFIMPMFHWKAALNYYVFNRASGDVVISKDRNFLFYTETVSPTDIGSSYSPIPAGHIDALTNNFNLIYDHYKAAGFDEVYLSMIPNSPTINQPDGYNGLIPQIQNRPNLRMKLIDIYSTFKNVSGDYYYHGDTHWNPHGKQTWVDIVNDTLINSTAHQPFSNQRPN
jgi:hypothetical protein